MAQNIQKKCQNYPETQRNEAQAPFLGDLSQSEKLSEIKPPLKYDARTRSEMYQHIFCSSLTSLVEILESCCDWLKDEQFLDGYILNWELLAEFCFNNIAGFFRILL